LWSGQLKSINPGHFVDVEVIKDLSHLTLDVIGQSSFGYNFNTVLGGESKISEAFATVLQGINFKYIICKFLIPFFDYLPLAETRKIQSAKEIADNTVIEVKCNSNIFHMSDIHRCFTTLFKVLTTGPPVFDVWLKLLFLHAWS